jgi:endonuclease/exonuclease/phosphatase family metal-dependent hydrolase
MESSTLRVMSFNVRNTSAPDGPNHWVHRKELWASTVRIFDPDLLGLQEVLADQYDEITGGMFPAYSSAGVARGDAVRQDEWALILYRTARFEQLAAGDFWLSQTPNVVGSRSWDAGYVRICTWVKLHDRLNGRELVHANTHFDNEGAVARLESATLLRQTLPTIAEGATIVLTGDFNCGEASEPYKVLVHPSQPDGLLLRDAYRELHPASTGRDGSYHDFGATEGERIDWILHSPGVSPTAAEIVRYRAPDGRFPSDHYPVTAILGWTNPE